MKGLPVPILLQVSLVHLVSHVHIMTVPSLLPLLPGAINVGFVELGFAVSLFNIVSALVQIPMGFATDRFGARRVLLLGLGAGSLAILLFACNPTYPFLIAACVLGGAANGVYHPGDYTILSRAVRSSGMGRAFSIHSFAGFLGSAITPGIVTAIALFSGIRSAFFAPGVLGLAILGLFLASRPSMRERRRPASTQRGERAKGAGGARRGSGVFSFPVAVLAFVFMLLSLSTTSLEKFSVSTFISGYDLDLALANTALTGFLFCSAFGVLSGGFLADKTTRHGFVASGAFALAALLVAVVTLVPVPGVLLVGILSVVGLLMGVIVPSRDMLVRAAAPKGAEGKVFGTVFTGYNIGSAVGPVLFGWLLDSGLPVLVFGSAVAFMLMTVLATSFQEFMLKRAA